VFQMRAPASGKARQPMVVSRFVCHVTILQVKNLRLHNKFFRQRMTHGSDKANNNHF